MWHGSGDAIIPTESSDAIVDQRLPLNGIVGRPAVADKVDSNPHRAWAGADRRITVEAYGVTGMGPATPLNASSAVPFGVAGPHVLDVAISSSHRIAGLWGLTDEVVAPANAAAAAPEEVPAAVPAIPAQGLPAARHARLRLEPAAKPQPASRIDVRRIIEDAHRVKGLMG